MNKARDFTVRKQILNMLQMHCMQFSKAESHFKKQISSNLLAEIASNFV